MNFKLLNKLFSSTALLALAGSGFASGFQLWEQDNAGIGDYHAGAAVDTNNTGIEFYNPAGMVFMNDPRPQASGGLTYIPLDVKFDGVVGLYDNGQIASHDTKGWVSGGTNNFVPNLHIIAPIGKKLALGFGITTPFGLKTKYPINSAVSSAATTTQLTTINFNPNVAFKAASWIGIGAGVDLQYGSAVFDSTIPESTHTDNNTLSDIAWGWNAGIYLKPTNSTDLGLAYRSSITHHAKGKNTVNGTESKTTATLPLPATLTISADQHIGNKFTLLASAEHTNWSSFKNLTIKNMYSPTYISGMNSEYFNLIAPFNYHNTWNIATGAHYKINRIITLEAGGGFDFTPTNDKDRDIRLPGTNRWAIALGAHLNLSKHFTMDGGWTYLIPTEKAKIDNQGEQGIPALTPPNSTYTITTKGLAKTNANVFGLQLTALL